MMMMTTTMMILMTMTTMIIILMTIIDDDCDIEEGVRVKMPKMMVARMTVGMMTTM